MTLRECKRRRRVTITGGLLMFVGRQGRILGVRSKPYPVRVKLEGEKLVVALSPQELERGWKRKEAP